MNLFDTIIKGLPFIMMLWFLSGTYSQFEEHERTMALENSKIPPILTKINKVKSDIAEIDEVKRNIVEYESRIADYNRQIEDIKIQIPPIEQKTKILDEFSETAKSLNIKNPIFRPKYVKENANGVYLSNGIEFEATGTYLQFVIMFERITRAQRILNVASLYIQNSRNKGLGRYNIVNIKATIESFHYSDVKKVERVKEK